MLKKFYIVDLIYYHSTKIFRYLELKLTSFFLIKYKRNLPQNLINLMKANRMFLNEVKILIPENEFDITKNNYGIQSHIYKNLEKEISMFPTNTDLLIYLIRGFNLAKINYLEIGTSVFKNFQQVENSVSNSNLYAYDINEPVSVIKQKYKFLEKIDKTSGQKYLYSKINNSITYIKNDVLSKEGGVVFKNLLSEKLNIVFSDALHTEKGILSEYDNLIKGNLADDFIYYFDDLNMFDVQSGVEKIYDNLRLKRDNINFYSFWCYGWIGQYEKLHKIGVITSFNIEKILIQDKFKLPFFKIN